jgi:hypothetical protein
MRVRLDELSYRDLCNRGSRLTEWWLDKGCPDFDRMPRRMLAEWEALRREFDRRGVQLSFDLSDGVVTH